MKWSRAAIVLLDSNDETIIDDALAWKARYQVPDQYCFSALDDDDCIPYGFVPLTPGCLSFSDVRTKIILVSHGLPQGISVRRSIKNAGVVSDWLKTWGVNAVGLLTFRGCLLGRGRFLDDLATMATVRGMRVGWLIGYRHEAWQWRDTWHECSGEYDYAIQNATNGACKASDAERVKIVRGNCDVSPPNGYSRRYQISTVV